MRSGYTLRSIRIGWWACVGAALIYSAMPILLEGPPRGGGLSRLNESSFTALFVVMLISALLTSILPFTVFGRKYIQRKSQDGQVEASAFLRLALAEAAVIMGVTVFFITGSYELYLIFFSLSILALILLKGDEDFYSELLSRVGEG